MINHYKEIQIITNLSPEDFANNFVGKKAVVIKGLIKDWPAIQKWNANYFKEVGKTVDVNVKIGNPRNKEYKKLKLADYVDYVSRSHIKNSNSIDQYLHDTQLLNLIPTLRTDLEPFVNDYLPKWYTYKWWQYILFFYGKQGATTPMHFDILGAHNLFFHIAGKKKFIIINSQEMKYCYMTGYNHSNINPENIDTTQYPLFSLAEAQEIVLHPGDVLYMPPYTLHYVKSITECISMNIDWHTKDSVLNAIKHSLKHQKFKIVWLNFLCILGLIFNLHSRYIYPLYKSYFKIL